MLKGTYVNKDALDPLNVGLLLIFSILLYISDLRIYAVEIKKEIKKLNHEIMCSVSLSTNEEEGVGGLGSEPPHPTPERVEIMFLRARIYFCPGII